MSKDKLHSYHVFLFPFAWEYTNTQPNSSFEEKTKLEDFVKKLKELKWQSEQFKPDTLLKYNEFNYFYDFARDVLYDQGNNANIIAHLYHSSFQKEEKEYRFEVKWESNEKFITKEYKLKIDSILLHLYSTGVGVLSIHLMNRADDQGEEDDILRINQYGRRIFPPFYDVPTELIGDQQQFEEKDWHNAISRTKEKVLPCWIELENGNKNKEDFLSNHGKGFQLPKFFEHLFGDKLFTANKSQNEGLIHLSPVLDDRMFVVCWYGNDGTATRLNPTKKQVKNLSLFNADEFWYKYVFVDGGMKTCQNDELSKTILESSTNDRWAKFGTFYGVSRYSFVCLTDSLATLRKNKAAFILNHIQTIYYKLVELSLVQRACLLRFSDEVTELSSLEETKNLTERMSSLYRQYLRFVNKIYFREITAQEQGIELYDLLQQKMMITRDVKELNGEIQELYQYTMLEEEKKKREIEEERNTQALYLNKLATIFLPASLIAAIFGFSTITSDMKFCGGIAENNFWTPLIITLIGGLAGLVYIKLKFRNNGK